MSYHDVEDARLYDAQNPWGPGDEFYLGLIRDARDVLDVGCGTGTLLKRADRSPAGPEIITVARRSA